jgi:hypothetical protein
MTDEALPAGARATIYNPFSVVNNARVAFASNRIPDALISPIAKRVLDLILLPNANELGGINHIRPFSNPTDNNQYHLRGDHAFTANDQLMLRYSRTTSARTNNTLNFNGDLTEINTKGGVRGRMRSSSIKTKSSLISRPRLSGMKHARR